MEHFAGLDVGTKASSLCVVDSDGEIVFEAEAPTDPALIARALRPWRRTLRRAGHEAGIEDVRIHDLRHTFASFGAGGGVGLPLIGGILGHRQASTTQRYAHLADTPLRAAANMIGGDIAASLFRTSSR